MAHGMATAAVSYGDGAQPYAKVAAGMPNSFKTCFLIHFWSIFPRFPDLEVHGSHFSVVFHFIFLSFLLPNFLKLAVKMNEK